MITFDSVLKGINKHTECSAGKLVSIIMRLLIFALSLSFLSGILLIETFPNLTYTSYIWIGLFMLVMLWLILGSLGKEKEAYDTVIKWKGVILAISILSVIVSVTILILL